jgi:hypothetical protein
MQEQQGQQEGKEDNKIQPSAELAEVKKRGGKRNNRIAPSAQRIRMFAKIGVLLIDRYKMELKDVKKQTHAQEFIKIGEAIADDDEYKTLTNEEKIDVFAEKANSMRYNFGEKGKKRRKAEKTARATTPPKRSSHFGFSFLFFFY